MSVKSVFSAATVLGLAASVTAGSMYVTSNAAVNQEAAATDEAAKTPVVPEVSERPAALAPDKIRHERSQEIVLDAQGGFAGQLFAMTGVDTTVPGAELSIRILQDGALVAETTTDATGRFAVTGLKPGVIGIIARGEAGLLLFGAHAVEATEQKPAALETDLQSALIAQDDVPLARELMRAAIGAEELRFKGAAGDDDAKFFSGEGDASTSLLSHRVQLGQDGVLRGTVNVLDPRTGKNREVLDETVYFLRNGVVAASTKVQHDGSFEIAGLEAGLYSVIGAGKDGSFAMGIEVVSFEAAQAELKKGAYSPVAIMATLDLSASPIGPNNLNSENFDENLGGDGGDGSTPPPPPTPPAGAPAGGGATGGGGGGGAGGGGGLGALLGAGIGAGLGYLAGNDNNSSSPGN
ncbi:MAG: carboxypeptidase-like regulatory domain-containing protein [Planctomycetaceae bacterium]